MYTSPTATMCVSYFGEVLADSNIYLVCCYFILFKCLTAYMKYAAVKKKYYRFLLAEKLGDIYLNSLWCFDQELFNKELCPNSSFVLWPMPMFLQLFYHFCLPPTLFHESHAYLSRCNQAVRLMMQFTNEC